MFIPKLLKNMFLFAPDTETISTVEETKTFDQELEDIDKELRESENSDVELDTGGEPATSKETDDISDNNDIKDEQNLESADKPTDVKDEKEIDDKSIEENKDNLDKNKPLDNNNDTLSDQQPGVITKELINQFPEDQQKTLLRYEGKPFSEALKTLVHQKQQIGKLSSRQNINIKPDNPYPDPKTQSDEANKLKEQLIDSRMRSIYPDYPKDEYEWNELQTSNYVKAHQYANERQQMSKNVASAYESAVYAQSNYHELNDTAIREASSQISDLLKTYGLDVQKDFGIDLSKDDLVNNFMDSLLVSKDGKSLDINVFETWENEKGETVLKYGVPIIREKALMNKFKAQYEPHIMLKIKENAFAQGMAAAKDTKLAPSFSTGNTTIRKSPSKVATPNSLEELDKAIEESENTNNY